MEDRGLLSVGEKWIRLFMVLAALLISMKYIIVDFGLDSEYQVAMSYRLARGDTMLREMWEPHQTSAFLCALFIKIYLFIFGTATGVVLWLQTIGVILKGVIALLLYRTVKKHLGCGNVAFAMAWVFFLVSPKDVPLPEFANMQIWFSMLLCIALFLYYKTNKKRWIILSAVFFCGAVLSYPSCLILLAGVLFLLLCRGDKKGVFLFLATCFLAGLFYLFLILRNVELSDLKFIIGSILEAEPTHSAGLGEKFADYFKQAIKIGGILCAAYLISHVSVKVISGRNIQAREKSRALTDILFYGIILLISIYTVVFWKENIRYNYSIFFLGVILIGTRYTKRLSGDKRYFYLCSTVISVLDFAATLLLTDLELIASVPYLLIAFTAAFLPAAEMLKMADGKTFQRNMKTVLFGGVILLIFRNAYIIRPMISQVGTVFDLGGIVKEGPAAGVISEYMGPYMQHASIEEWKQYIKEGSNIYIIGGTFDNLGYLYLDTNVAAPSVMNTSGYNGCIPDYWKMNPDRYPDVVIASCWFGNMDSHLTEESGIMKWIMEEYKPEYYIDGKYWRYYFRSGPDSAQDPS